MNTHLKNLILTDAHADSGTPSSPETHSPEAQTSRRVALRSLGKVGLGLAFASAPAFFAGTQKARAQSGGRTVTDVLNFALTLEYLERDYYQTGLDSGVIPTGQPTQVYQIIRDHEAAHVDFLLDQLGDDAVDRPSFDFTAGGMFDPFTNYQTFLLLSQAFEDTGVRAYKGQAPFLIDNDAVLTAALTIHSVEGRHASKVRRMRGLQGWIPFDQPDAPAAVAPVYAGMNQTMKYQIDVPAVSGVAAEQVTEAWDEPLTTEEVLAIVGPFIEG